MMNDDYTSETWLIETIRYFRRLGFFATFASMPDHEVLTQVQRFHGVQFFYEVLTTAKSRAATDMIVLQADQSRTWAYDLECVYCGADAYATSLRDWTAISRGSFTPTQITETWLSEAGPVHVTFTFRGMPYTYLHADGFNDFINLDILKLINGLIQDTPYRFEAGDDYPGDCRFIVVLTGAEKARLQHERGWEFCDFLTRA
jgi:hypothetical protein